MLNKFDAVATIAVKDVEQAARFYEKTLGLKRVATGMGTVRLQSGNASILIYPSQFAGTNQATAITWVVDDVDKIVKDLKAKGVVFEHYDMPNARLEGDVHVYGPVRNAWLKDPSGNILSIVSE